MVLDSRSANLSYLSRSPITAEIDHGPHSPHEGTPARRRGSVRRTTSHTCLRPDGLVGDVHVVARARDIWTGTAGDHTIVGEAEVDAVIGFIEDRSLRSISVKPTAADLDDLVGLRVSSGFRRAVDEALSEEDQGASLRYQLLDDLPTAVLVSGVAIASFGASSGASTGRFPPRKMIDMSSMADICAGWARDGSMMIAGRKLGHPPMVIGPAAPALDAPDSDPLAWHPMEHMTPHSTRRRRRIDVWRDPQSQAGDGVVVVEEFFRDSMVDADGAETVVHEYLVSAELDPGHLTFRSCSADIGVLPWVECPAAAASAERLTGTTPHDLRERVRQTFVGTSTCTHLNDTLRALAAVPYLVSIVNADGVLRT